MATLVALLKCVAVAALSVLLHFTLTKVKILNQK